MNKRKLIGLVASVMVAGLGTLVLLKYANSSKATPQAAVSEPTVPVLKVQRLIVKGTPAEQIRDAVTVEQIPVSQKLSDAADNVDLLTGLVASTDLLPNEQVVKARFIPAAEQRKQEIGSGSGLIGVWITLDPVRALNGAIKVNDTVAVFGSFNGVGQNNPAPMSEDIGSPSTHLVLHKVPVLDVIGASVEAAPAADGQPAPTTPVAPSLQIKLGVDAASAERLVFLASFGQIYLGAEDLDVPEENTKIVDRANLYTPTPKTAAVVPPKTDVVGAATAASTNAADATATPVSVTKATTPGAKPAAPIPTIPAGAAVAPTTVPTAAPTVPAAATAPTVKPGAPAAATTVKP